MLWWHIQYVKSHSEWLEGRSSSSFSLCLPTGRESSFLNATDRRVHCLRAEVLHNLLLVVDTLQVKELNLDGMFSWTFHSLRALLSCMVLFSYQEVMLLVCCEGIKGF